MNDIAWKPLGDGFTHIYIYSRARTPLGRFLTNFAYSPFTHPDHGEFVSVEGYWYWLKTGRIHREFRSLSGFEAKSRGKKAAVVEHPEGSEGFERDVKVAIRAKLIAHPVQLNELIDSTLPLVHYYFYGDPANSPKVINAGYEWITEYIDSIRVSCQNANFRAKER